MSWIHALIIGILQGLTEFFPVSSSAHLKLARMVFGIESGSSLTSPAISEPRRGALFFAERHLGPRPEENGLLGLSHLPLVPAYFLLKSFRVWAAQPQFLGVCFLLTAAFYFWGTSIRFARDKKIDRRFVDRRHADSGANPRHFAQRLDNLCGADARLGSRKRRSAFRSSSPFRRSWEGTPSNC